MRVEELLKEGFSGFTVSDSDTASDLWYECKDAIDDLRKDSSSVLASASGKLKLAAEAKAVLPVLKKGLKNKGNAYNTHGTFNVAMVITTHLQKHVAAWPALQEFTKEVEAKLNKEVIARRSTLKFTSEASDEYTRAMLRYAKRLEELTK